MWKLSQGLRRFLIVGLWDRKKLETRNPELETAKAQEPNHIRGNGRFFRV
jgi:hypothetical protein